MTSIPPAAQAGGAPLVSAQPGPGKRWPTVGLGRVGVAGAGSRRVRPAPRLRYKKAALQVPE